MNRRLSDVNIVAKLTLNIPSKSSTVNAISFTPSPWNVKWSPISKIIVEWLLHNIFEVKKVQVHLWSTGEQHK